MAAGDVATVFLEMSLGTRLVISNPASPTTVADLKRIVSHEHAACFPHLGQIAVQSIKIHHGGSWFHLADSMAVWDAFRFQGINERWHLQVDASLQVDQGMVTQGHSGGANSANHSEPAPGGHGYEGSSSRRRSSSEMLPGQVEAEAEATPTEREQLLTAKGERSRNGAEQDTEQGTWKKRLRPRTQVGKTPIDLSSNGSSESEETDINTVDAPAPTPLAPTPQFAVELKKCHFVEQNGQYLNVPPAFSRAHGYTEKKKVLLRMGGESWTVNLKHGHNGNGNPRTSLRYGWHQFCVDNRLRVGETCIFRALPGGGGDHHELKVEENREIFRGSSSATHLPPQPPHQQQSSHMPTSSAPPPKAMRNRKTVATKRGSASTASAGPAKSSPAPPRGSASTVSAGAAKSSPAPPRGSASTRAPRAFNAPRTSTGEPGILTGKRKRKPPGRLAGYFYASGN